MGTHYYEIADPITRLEVSGDTPYKFVRIWVGAAESGHLTIPTEHYPDFMDLLKGECAGKVFWAGKEKGRIFSPAKAFKPNFRTHLISERGEVVHYDSLIGNL